MDLVASNAAILLSAIAIFATVRSNLIAEKARKLTEEVSRKQQGLAVYQQRTLLLKEVDHQQSLLNRLATVSLQKIVLLQSCEHSHDIAERITRLRKNIDATEHLRSRYGEQRNAAYAIESDASLNENERNLADVRRLTLHIEQEIENEISELEDIRELTRNKS